MRIREDVLTRATPEQAWDLIADPALHELWNPRIVATVPSGSATPGVGYRYRVTYDLNGRRTEMDAEIVEFSPPHKFGARLEERYKGDGRNAERRFEERYTIDPRGGRTHVSHEIVIHHSGIHPLLRLLIEFVLRFGKPTGKPYMETFRELAESETAVRRAR